MQFHLSTNIKIILEYYSVISNVSEMHLQNKNIEETTNKWKISFQRNCGATFGINHVEKGQIYIVER